MVPTGFTVAVSPAALIETLSPGTISGCPGTHLQFCVMKSPSWGVSPWQVSGPNIAAHKVVDGVDLSSDGNDLDHLIEAGAGCHAHVVAWEETGTAFTLLLTLPLTFP
jgi:hypothetical protein